MVLGAVYKQYNYLRGIVESLTEHLRLPELKDNSGKLACWSTVRKRRKYNTETIQDTQSERAVMCLVLSPWYRFFLHL